MDFVLPWTLLLAHFSIVFVCVELRTGSKWEPEVVRLAMNILLVLTRLNSVICLRVKELSVLIAFVAVPSLTSQLAFLALPG